MKIIRKFSRGAIQVSLLSLIVGCSTINSASENMRFEVLGCSKSDVGTVNSQEVKGSWVNGVYRIDVKNQIICSASIKNPTYRVEGAVINLSYDADLSGKASKCYCQSSSVFYLTKIPQQSYEINFHVNYR